MIYQQFKLPNGDTSESIVSVDLNEIITTIPNDPENSDWKKYQAWLAEGNEPLPPPED